MSRGCWKDTRVGRVSASWFYGTPPGPLLQWVQLLRCPAPAALVGPRCMAPPMYGIPPQSLGELLGGVLLAWQFPINAFPGTPLGSFTGSSSRESQPHLLQWTWISVLGRGVEGDDRLFRMCSFLVCSLSALSGCPCICYSILDSSFYSLLATPHYSNSLFHLINVYITWSLFKLLAVYVS